MVACNFRGIAAQRYPWNHAFKGRILPRCARLRGPTRMEASPITGFFRLFGYAILGGGTFVVLVVVASLLHSDLATAWTAEIRRLREKAR